MERSEPSLVPGWLKVHSSGGHSGALRSDEPTSHSSRPRFELHHERSSGRDLLSPRVPTSHSSTSRADHWNGSAPRTGSGHSRFDKGNHSTLSASPRGGQQSLPRSNSHRSYDISEKDWDGGAQPVEKTSTPLPRTEDADKERGEVPGSSVGVYKPPNRRHEEASGRRPGGSFDEARERTQANGTAVPAVAGSTYSSSVHKAVFERNFPSLGITPGGGGSAANGIAGAVSPRPQWQLSSPRAENSSSHAHVNRNTVSSPRAPALADGVVAVTGGPGSTVVAPGPGGSGTLGFMEGGGWTSALADLPPEMKASFANGISSSLAAAPSTPSAAPGPPMMAETLAKTVLHAKSSSQSSVESQRLEELVLKQSRQLVPMKPTLPKNLGPGARDKVKGKVTQLVASKAVGAGTAGGSQLLGAAAAAASRTGGGGGGAAAVRGVVGAPQASLARGVQLAAAAGPAAGASLSPVGGAGLARQRIQLLDRHSLPIAPASQAPPGAAAAIGPPPRRPEGVPAGPAGQPPSAAGAPTAVPPPPAAAALEDRRGHGGSQNRSDFFKELRRKAEAGSGSDKGTTNGTKTVASAEAEPEVEGGARTPDYQQARLDVAAATVAGEALANEDRAVGVDLALQQKGAAEYAAHPIARERPAEAEAAVLTNGRSYPAESQPAGMGSAKTSETVVSEGGGCGSPPGLRRDPSALQREEEEEAAFLRSLGWQEDAEEALTEEEISAFLQSQQQLGLPSLRERTRSLTLRGLPPSNHQTLRSVSSGPRLSSSFAAVSSELTSSDSESD